MVKPHADTNHSTNFRSVAMLRIIESLPQTFFSRPFYAALLRRGQGIGMGLILILTAIDLAGAAITGYGPMQQFKAGIAQIAADLPEVTAQGGKISINQPAPFVVDLSRALPTMDSTEAARAPKIVFDPNYAVSDVQTVSDKMRNENIAVLITSEQAIVLQGRNQDIRFHSLQNMPDGVMMHEDWIKLGEKIAFWFVPVIVLLAVIFIFLVKLAGVFLLAIAANLIGGAMKAVPDFSAAMRLAAAAAVPVTCLSLLVAPGFWLKILIWGGYIGFGIWSAHQPPEQPADAHSAN